MKKLFIFDFDGTLVNTITELQYLMNQALKIHDFKELTIPEYVKAVNGNVDEVISNLLKPYDSDDNIRKVKKTYLEICTKPHVNQARPFDGIYDMLKLLQKENKQIAINSNRYTDSIKSYTDKFFKDIKFYDIQGHNPPYPSKPDAYGINQILDKAGVDKMDVVYIGDSSTDIQTAKNAGIDCIIVDWGYSASDEIEDEYVRQIIKNVDELKDYIITNQ